ncbi:MAG TPA: hypothetical protein VF690_15650, partial [Hymenobacter sp.]
MLLDLPTNPAELRELLLTERARREQAEAEVARLRFVTRIPQLNPNQILRVSAEGELLFANAAASKLARELQTPGPSQFRVQLLHAITEALLAGEV